MRRKKSATSTHADQPRRRTGISYSTEEAQPSLTVREKDVLYWVARGKANPEIAGILHTSPETIRKHVQNIRQKFGSESRLSVVAAYWQREIDARDSTIEQLKRRR